MDVAVILTDSPSLMVVNFRDGEILTEIPLDSNRKYSHLLHPPTYENKVLVTNDFGEIELFNIKTGKVNSCYSCLSINFESENILIRRAQRKEYHNSSQDASSSRDWSRPGRWNFFSLEHKEE